MLGYFEGQVVASPADPHRAPLHPGIAELAQPRRPPRQRGGGAMEGGREGGHIYGEGMDKAILCAEDRLNAI